MGLLRFCLVGFADSTRFAKRRLGGQRLPYLIRARRRIMTQGGASSLTELAIPLLALLRGRSLLIEARCHSNPHSLLNTHTMIRHKLYPNQVQMIAGYLRDSTQMVFRVVQSRHERTTQQNFSTASIQPFKIIENPLVGHTRMLNMERLVRPLVIKKKDIHQRKDFSKTGG